MHSCGRVRRPSSFKVGYSDQVADLLGDMADRVAAELVKVAFTKIPVPVVMGSHLLVVTMKGNGADLEFGVELDLANKTAEIAFRHECDQGHLESRSSRQRTVAVAG